MKYDLVSCLLSNDVDCSKKMENKNGSLQLIGEKELENSNVDTEVLIKSNNLIILIVCVFIGLVMKETIENANITRTYPQVCPLHLCLHGGAQQETKKPEKICWKK